MLNKNKLQKKYQNSITFRYLSIATIFLMVIQLIISGIQNKRLYDREVKRIHQKIETDANFLSIVARDSLLSSDLNTLKDLARYSHQDRDVIYGIFLDGKQQIIASDLQENIIINGNLLNTKNHQEPTQKLIDKIKADSTIKEISQLIYIGDRKIGEVRLAYSIMNPQQELKLISTLDFAYATLVSILFATLTLIIFNSQILYPLKKIKKLAKEFASGNLEERISIVRKDEIGELGDALNSMASQLKYSLSNLEKAMDEVLIAEKAKSKFLRKMSHELKTPLNGIIGFTQLMQQDSITTLEQIESLDIIEQNSLHLLSLINDVLEITKIESGKSQINLSKFNFHNFLDSLEQMFSFKAQEKNIALEFDIHRRVPRYIENDREKLRQIIVNLLENSIKFTSQGEITVTVKNKIDKKNETTSNLYFKIADTGQGISPEKIDNLFVIFAQTEDGITKSEGMGLGLPISRQLIQLMGGDISIKSKINQGTTVRFTIPITKIEANELNVSQDSSLNLDSSGTDSIESKFFYDRVSSYDLTRKKLAIMPVKWLKELQESTIKVDNDLIFAVLEKIPNQDQDLKQALMDLIDNFRYDSILELTDDALSKK